MAERKVKPAKQKSIFHGITWFTYHFPWGLTDTLVIRLTASNRFMYSEKCLFELPLETFWYKTLLSSNVIILKGLKELWRTEINIKHYIFQWQSKVIEGVEVLESGEDMSKSLICCFITDKFHNLPDLFQVYVIYIELQPHSPEGFPFWHIRFFFLLFLLYSQAQYKGQVFHSR